MWRLSADYTPDTYHLLITNSSSFAPLPTSCRQSEIQRAHGFGGEYETDAQLAARVATHFGSGQETDAQRAAREAQLRSERPVWVTLVCTGERFRSQIQPEKTANGQYTLRATKAMQAAFNKAVSKKKCGPSLSWTKPLPTTCDGGRWKVEEFVEDA